MEEVKKNPWGEVAWYFEDSREQYRLGGNITIVGHDHSDEKLVEVGVQRIFSPCAAHMTSRLRTGCSRLHQHQRTAFTVSIWGHRSGRECGAACPPPDVVSF